jgi:hypothetical protein
MRTLALATLLLTTSAGAVEITPTMEEPKDCSIRIDFGSYCCGTDAALRRWVEAYIAANEAISEVTEFRWGFEGESTLCLQIASLEQARTVFEDVKAMIPAESRQTWSAVTLETGEAFQTKWPQ